ncbi:MAG: uroporphyrinogen decarboxylase family protein [Candidatus Omnitrophota bacterium]
MTSRTLIRDTLARRKTSRIPMTDLCYWAETIKRWEGEGLPFGTDLYNHFGLDRIFLYYPNDSPRLEARVIEADEKTILVTDEWGRTVKRWKNATATPINLGYGVRDISEVPAYLDHYDKLENESADEKQINDYRQSLNRGDFTAISPMEPAWFIVEYLLGFEKGLPAFLTDPKEVSRAMWKLMNYSLRHVKWLIEVKGIHFDALYFSADLCYRNGMLFSPKIYRELIMPIHQEYKRFCAEHNMFFMLHCDGDVREFIPLVIESGFDAIEPLEARAGNDVRELKALYGDRITFFGNINADIIANGTKEQIREEVISKVNVAKQGGGYIYHIDHSVPPTISLDNYSFLIKTLKEAAKIVR